jgi:flavin-dependent dehydrogenase
MEDKRFRIAIVGGGSSGWMAAAYLSKVLSFGVDITLIESPQIGTIGVGEASFSTLHLFFETLELQEKDWMAECNASYKLAIKFVNWNAEGSHFYHPFQRLEMVQGRSIAEWWHKLKQNSAPFDYACFTVPSLCDAKSSPRYLDGIAYDDQMNYSATSRCPTGRIPLDELKIQYPYGFHFDASLLAIFLSKYAQTRGVIQVQDEVTNVSLAENGFIQSLKTKEHGELAADLFIDCTGFRGLLINQLLQEPFISFSDFLLCDRAVAMQVPSFPEIEGIEPYTTATALSAGWVWNIPLFHRIGTGYVYSSAFLSPDAAERELRTHLGKRAEGCNASHIQMRIGRHRRSWVKNCVAIGLSSGFVEPLESTGIFFIQHGIDQLVRHFPGRAFPEDNIDAYNKRVGDCIDGVREFLTLHYRASSRNDTSFWRATKSMDMPSASLAERLRLWKVQLPSNDSIPPHYHGFEAYSYCVMMLGLGHRPDSTLPVLDHMDQMQALQMFHTIKERSKYLVSTLPSAYQYLSLMHGNGLTEPSGTVCL